jgi:hypothetical protein
LSSISSTYSSTENDLPQSRQYRLTPLQAITSFIFPLHFLHFIFVVYPEEGLNENTGDEIFFIDQKKIFVQKNALSLPGQNF